MKHLSLLSLATVLLSVFGVQAPAAEMFRLGDFLYTQTGYKPDPFVRLDLINLPAGLEYARSGDQNERSSPMASDGEYLYFPSYTTILRWKPGAAPEPFIDIWHPAVNLLEIHDGYLFVVKAVRDRVFETYVYDVKTGKLVHSYPFGVPRPEEILDWGEDLIFKRYPLLRGGKLGEAIPFPPRSQPWTYYPERNVYESEGMIVNPDGTIAGFMYYNWGESIITPTIAITHEASHITVYDSQTFEIINRYYSNRMPNLRFFDGMLLGYPGSYWSPDPAYVVSLFKPESLDERPARPDPEWWAPGRWQGVQGIVWASDSHAWIDVGRCVILLNLENGSVEDEWCSSWQRGDAHLQRQTASCLKQPIYFVAGNNLLRGRPDLEEDELVYTGSLSDAEALPDGTLLIAEKRLGGSNVVWYDPDARVIRDYVKTSGSSSFTFVGQIGETYYLSNGDKVTIDQASKTLEIQESAGGAVLLAVNPRSELELWGYGLSWDSEQRLELRRQDEIVTSIAVSCNSAWNSNVWAQAYKNGFAGHFGCRLSPIQGIAVIDEHGDVHSVPGMEDHYRSDIIVAPNRLLSVTDRLVGPGAPTLDAFGNNVFKQNVGLRESPAGYYYRQEDWYYFYDQDLWIYAVKDSDSPDAGTWLYMDKIGWSWTKADYMQYLYSIDLDCWLFWFTESRDPRWYFRYDTRLFYEDSGEIAPRTPHRLTITTNPANEDYVFTIYGVRISDSLGNTLNVTCDWTRTDSDSVQAVFTDTGWYFEMKIDMKLEFTTPTTGTYSLRAVARDSERNKIIADEKESGTFTLKSDM